MINVVFIGEKKPEELFRRAAAKKSMKVVTCGRTLPKILKACRKQKPDVVVLESEGTRKTIDAVAALKALSLTVLVLAGKWDTVPEWEILHAGAAGWIARPISVIALADVVEKLALYTLE